VVKVQRPPRIEGPKEVNVEVTLNDELELRCPASGVPAPEIEWFRNAEKIPSEITANNPQQIHIKKIKTAAQGEWKCKATSNLGKIE
jgi:hypothetical protein